MSDKYKIAIISTDGKIHRFKPDCFTLFDGYIHIW